MATVQLRVETSGATVFNGPVAGVVVGNVQPETGPARLCNGLNGHENPFAGPTCTNALDRASRPGGPRPFVWDGTFSPSMEDFLITQINVVSGPQTFWSLWLNYKYATVGGCQLQVKTGDSVLWALIPSQFDSEGVPLSIPLKLNGPHNATAGTAFSVRITNGSNRSAVPYALVKASMGTNSTEVQTDINGLAVLTLAAGTWRLKARRVGDISSNEFNTVVA